MARTRVVDRVLKTHGRGPWIASGVMVALGVVSQVRPALGHPGVPERALGAGRVLDQQQHVGVDGDHGGGLLGSVPVVLLEVDGGDGERDPIGVALRRLRPGQPHRQRRGEGDPHPLEGGERRRLQRTTKYLAAGWWRMIAEVVCSGWYW